jgi:hypothetical protein
VCHALFHFCTRQTIRASEAAVFFDLLQHLRNCVACCFACVQRLSVEQFLSQLFKLAMTADVCVDVLVVSDFQLLQVGDVAVDESIDALLCFGVCFE